MKIKDWFEKNGEESSQNTQTYEASNADQANVTPQDYVMQETEPTKTIIMCPSTCKFANDPTSPNKCVLSKIELEQRNNSIFVCTNFEDMGSYKQ
jgi:hypothetical protein